MLYWPSVHASFLPAPPWLDSESSHPLSVSGFLRNWHQPAQRWARDSDPANQPIPASWSWLAHGWARDPGQWDSILGFCWNIRKEKLRLHCSCWTWGCKPGPPGKSLLKHRGPDSVVWAPPSALPALRAVDQKMPPFLCMAIWVVYGHFQTIEHLRNHYTLFFIFKTVFLFIKVFGQGTGQSDCVT